MAVSKHNLWKRQKHGLMKLVRSHSEWLDRRRARKARKKSTTIRNTQWWEKDTVGRGTPTTSTKGPYMADTPSSTKRTQVGKKI